MPSEPSDAKLRWEGEDVPVSSRFDDPYYARKDGLAESRHVFLKGNDLKARWQNAVSFRIAELGFGTGLNCLAAAMLWAQKTAPGGLLTIQTFELFPLSADELQRALSRWTELNDLSQALLSQWPAEVIKLPGVEITLSIGDARTLVPQMTCGIDAWFLDGFAPARNPELWTPDLMAAVAATTKPGGSCATYSAAGHVRRSLQAAGFVVTRQRGFGTKREMLTGRLPG